MKLKPIVTEKTIKDTEKRRYTFSVPVDQTKDQLKKHLGKLFKVDVIKVQTAIMPGKQYRSGKKWIYRKRPDWKKVVITIKANQKIELFDIPNQT